MPRVETADGYLSLGDSLLATFRALVHAFDTKPHDAGLLVPFLDEHVVLNTLSPPDIIIGKTDVLDYFRDRFEKDPCISFVALTTNVVAPTGTVSGTGLWVDKDTGPDGEHIWYSFVFILYGERDWRVVNLWGTESLGP